MEPDNPYAQPPSQNVDPFNDNPHRNRLKKIIHRKIPNMMFKELLRQKDYLEQQYEDNDSTESIKFLCTDEFNDKLEMIVYGEIPHVAERIAEEEFKRRVDRNLKQEVERRFDQEVQDCCHKILVQNSDPNFKIIRINGITYKRITPLHPIGKIIETTDENLRSAIQREHDEVTRRLNDQIF